MSKKKGIALTVVIVAMACGVFAVTQINGKESEPVEETAPEIMVTAQLMSTGDIAQEGEFIGSVEPDESIQVITKVSGEVLATYYEIGDHVKKGELLYEIDSTDLQIAYDASVASYKASQIQADQKLGSTYDSQLISLKQAVDNAQENLNSARTNLKNLNDDEDDDLLRAQKAESKALAEMNAADDEKSKHAKDSAEYKKAEQEYQTAKENYSLAHAEVKDLDDDDDPDLRSARTAYQNAQIAYDAAKASYDQNAGISREDSEKTSDASLKAIEEGLKQQEKQLEYTKVYAPIDGIIEQKNISEHDMIGPSSSTYTISNKNLMIVKFSVSEDAIEGFSLGDTIKIEKSGEMYDGTITEVPTMVDETTGLYTLKASAPDSVLLHNGSVVKIYADTQKSENAYLLPTDCVYYDDGNAFVYVFENGTAVKKPVEVGITNNGKVEILSGIVADNQVINTWNPNLRDGATVTLSANADNA